MNRNIAVVTGTRAEYGLLYWTIKAIQQSSRLGLQLLVTGTHLSPAHGYTYKQIESDGLQIDKKIEMLLASDTPQAVSKSMALAAMGFSQAYEELRPDILVLLGDRYEILAAACAAIPFQIPIAHIHGGESTEGAMDEQIRHAVTKLSHIHFASAACYADIIKKMGEEEWRVFNVGAPGLEWLQHNPLLTRQQLEKQLGVDLSRETILATFHPVTTEYKNTEQYIDNLLQALKQIDAQIVFTGANADPGGNIINEKLTAARGTHPNLHFFENLGQQRYLSCLKYCSLMLGNSSSGIIEAPSFHLPVVNIGNRQKGRLQSGNVIDVGYGKEEIIAGIQRARSSEFKAKILGISNVYGDGRVSERMVHVLETIDLERLKTKRLAYGGE